MKNNSELRNAARESLKGKWGIAIGGCLIYNLITINNYIYVIILFLFFKK